MLDLMGELSYHLIGTARADKVKDLIADVKG